MTLWMCHPSPFSTQTLRKVFSLIVIIQLYLRRGGVKGAKTLKPPVIFGIT